MLERTAPPYAPPVVSTRRIQQTRNLTQLGFMLFFVLAPALDIFRFDMPSHHFIVLTLPWMLGIDAFSAGDISATQLGANLLLRFVLPVLSLIALVVWVSWKYGRVYCGWLCPHFSVVEVINQTMRRAIGKQSVWDRHTLPQQNPDGTTTPRSAWWWLVVVPLASGFAFLWTISILTYLWPPAQVWGDLVNASLPRFQVIFLAVGTAAFSMEFLFARHLFCRFACAAGLFQSLAWMANRNAMVVGYARDRAPECAGCESVCDNACPMRLPPRNVKRMMFSCVQCGQCLNACANVNAPKNADPLLTWVHEDRAGQEASFNTRAARQGAPAPGRLSTVSKSTVSESSAGGAARIPLKNIGGEG